VLQLFFLYKRIIVLYIDNEVTAAVIRIFIIIGASIVLQLLNEEQLVGWFHRRSSSR
jgi:hypothetical protein